MPPIFPSSTNAANALIEVSIGVFGSTLRMKDEYDVDSNRR
jgi:hypothetical protein